MLAGGVNQEQESSNRCYMVEFETGKLREAMPIKSAR